jgi:hypothetical protein
MKGCARTCLLWLAGWAIAALSFFAYFRTLGDLPEGIYWASAGAGLCAIAVLGYILGIGNAAKERAMLIDSMTGTPPTDGKWVAVSGRIHSMHKLHAPLSGESVVAYTYKIWRSEGSGKSSTQVTHFEGKALIPSTIATRTGTVRLLAVPLFDFPDEELDLDKAFGNASEYIARTTFETDATPKDQRAGTMEKESADDDGNFRVDKRSKNAMEIPIDSCHLEEKHIKQNEMVCAFGLYSAARSGLIPHANWAKQTRVMRGDAETGARLLRNRMLKYLIGIAVFGAAIGGIVWACRVHAVPFT